MPLSSSGAGAAVMVLLATVGFSSAATLGISADGRFFTVDGEPTFLHGVSYYGALSITDPLEVEADLDAMVADGFNWIRVWVCWQYPMASGGADYAALTRQGAVREPYMGRLKSLIQECNERGIIVDCTLKRSNGTIFPSSATSQSEHLAQARALTSHLLAYRNVYFDLANERDVLGENSFVSLADCGALIDAVKAIDPARLCTVSDAKGGFDSQNDLGNYRSTAHCDFVSPHLCRNEGCSAQTAAKVRQYVGWMNNLGFRIPIHLQEPFRKGWTGYQPAVEDYYRDCTGGKIAEAAGWCLHNGDNKAAGDFRPRRSFDMSPAEGRLYEQWMAIVPPDELTAARGLLGEIGSIDAGIRRYQVEYVEQVAHQIGRRDGFAWSATVSQDGPGYLTQGPGLNTVPAGDHQVTWCLKIADPAGNNDPVMALNVYAGGQTLASRTLCHRDFPAAAGWQLFTLSFTSSGQAGLEFRTNWLDVVDAQCDWIELALAGASSVPPVIAGIPADPDRVRRGEEYRRQLALSQGDPVPVFAMPQGPPGVQISNSGLVSGWTPGAGDTGRTVTFEVRAANVAGADTASWQVFVQSVADLDGDDDVDQTDFGRLQSCLSEGTSVLVGCEPMDLDANGAVQQGDLDIFLECMGGANQPPGC